MSNQKRHRSRPRLRSSHVVLAILAFIVVTACGNALVADPASRALPDAEIDLMVASEQLASKVVGNGSAGSLDALQPLAADDRGFGEFDRGRDEVGLVSASEAESSRDDTRIIRTASLELEVGDVPASLTDASAEITGLGGYVSGSDVFDQGERTWASVVYRVPVDRFAEAMSALRGLSDDIVRESTQSQEVTAQIVDLEARITNLQASEEALVEIMDRTGRIDDVLAVQLRLEDVRGQIERLEAQRANLGDQAANATLTVQWFTPIAAVAAAQQGWSLATEVDAALAQTVEALQGVATFAVWLAVVGLPTLGIPLLLIVALAMILRRRIRASSTATPSATPAE